MHSLIKSNTAALQWILLYQSSNSQLLDYDSSRIGWRWFLLWPQIFSILIFIEHQRTFKVMVEWCIFNGVLILIIGWTILNKFKPHGSCSRIVGSELQFFAPPVIFWRRFGQNTDPQVSANIRLWINEAFISPTTRKFLKQPLWGTLTLTLLVKLHINSSMIVILWCPGAIYGKCRQFGIYVLPLDVD